MGHEAAMSSMQRLELRQGQSLTMTPQLVQSIKLLQLSHLELSAYVEAELERNPLLHEGEAAADAPSPTLADFLQAKRRSEGAGPRPIPGPAPLRAEAASGGQAAPSGHAELRPDLEDTLARAATLTEHLENQLELATADPRLREIGRHLIHTLDEAGYLREDPGEIAGALAAGAGEVEAALRLIQTFEPPGVGARSLEECLAIQLRERDRLDPAMGILLAHLPLAARQDFAALRRLCGVDREDLAHMLAEIRRLEPKPGLAFTPARIDLLVPDVLVRPLPEGGFRVELNPDTLPRILLNRSYYAQVAKLVREDEDKSFLSECLQSASWLTRSLDQRARTILRVATEIARNRRISSVKAIAALRPMTLKAWRRPSGMHESTVSRVAANKAVGTERGTYPCSSSSAAPSERASMRQRPCGIGSGQLVDGESAGRCAVG
jgi:RNA polymerase sigma-54 factor